MAVRSKLDIFVYINDSAPPSSDKMTNALILSLRRLFGLFVVIVAFNIYLLYLESQGCKERGGERDLPSVGLLPK